MTSVPPDDYDDLVEPEKTLPEIAVDLAQGNFGALRVVSEIIKAGHTDLDQGPLHTLLSQRIKGPAIWVLYKDRCGQDLGKLVDLLLRPPADLKQLSEERV